jgi:hypothetical protein
MLLQYALHNLTKLIKIDKRISLAAYLRVINIFHAILSSSTSKSLGWPTPQSHQFLLRYVKLCPKPWNKFMPINLPELKVKLTTDTE